MKFDRARLVTVTVLSLGVFFGLVYAAWVMLQPRGDFEFAYAPSVVEPLPYAAMRGFTYEQLWSHVCRGLLLGSSLALLSYFLWRRVPVNRYAPGRRLWLVASALCVAVTSFVLLAVLKGRAIVDDELAYSMQARFLSMGRIGGPDVGLAPPDHFTIATRVGYTGKYLPGEALVQVPGVLVDLPALTHLLLLALLLFGWHRTVVLAGSERQANLATAALAFSPMLMLTSATGLSHLTALLGIVLMGWGLGLADHRRFVRGGALAAFGLGYCALTRPQSAAPAGLALVLPLLLVLTKHRSWRGWLSFVGVSLLFGGLIAGYDARLSGSSFRLPWYLQCGAEHFGFGQVWTHDRFLHTPLTALENLGVVAVRLNAWWLGLPLGLLLIPLWMRFGKPVPGQRRWYLFGLVIILFEALYYSPGVSDTGSVYHFELLLPGSLLVAGLVDGLLDRWGTRAASVILLNLALGTGTFLAEQTWRLDRLVTAIHRDSDRALASVTRPALLIHEMIPAEQRSLGWVFDSFPRRYRGLDDPVVTFPRLGPELMKQVFSTYRGRSCWYFHRRPRGGEAELLRCADARAFLDRPFVFDADERPLWVAPTAYRKTDFDPFRYTSARKLRDAEGQPRMPCCQVRRMAELGVDVLPKYYQTCVPEK